MNLRVFEKAPFIFAENKGEISDVFIIIDKDDMIPMTQIYFSKISKILCYSQKTKSIGYLYPNISQFSVLTPKIECKIFEDAINSFVDGWNKNKTLS